MANCNNCHQIIKVHYEGTDYPGWCYTCVQKQQSLFTIFETVVNNSPNTKRTLTIYKDNSWQIGVDFGSNDSTIIRLPSGHIYELGKRHSCKELDCPARTP